MVITMARTLGELLKTERVKKGLSQRQLAISSGVSRPYINLIESGHRITKSTDILIALAKALGIPPAQFIGIEEGHYEAARMVKEAVSHYQALELVELPIRGSVPAGSPFPNEQESGEFIEVPRQVLNGIAPLSLYALRISGDSLRGDEIYSGDCVIVNPDDTALVEGRIYIVRLGSEVCARHIFGSTPLTTGKQDDHLRLVSSDNISPSISLGTSQEITAAEVEVLGRVILSGRWKKH